MIKMIFLSRNILAFAIFTCQTALNKVRVNATSVKCSSDTMVDNNNTHVLFLHFCLIVRYTYSTNHVYLHRFSRLRFCVCV